MLQRKGRKHRQKLKALTDPQPEFVSLVFGGANKTPFRAMRADGSAIGEDVMADPEISAKTHAIAKVEFSSDRFADETAVKDWLTSGGYDPDEVAITKTDEGFMVDNTSGLDKDAVLGVIDMVDAQGLKIFTVALKGDEPDEELELTEKQMHPGASLLDMTMGFYESARKSIIAGDKSVTDLAVQFASQVNELITKLPSKDDDLYGPMMQAIAPEIEVEKIEEAQKLGARNNAKDKKMIQQMHDHSVALGASCDGDYDSMQKAAPKPYGDVKYADPKNGKYPIDTEEHIRAAWNYINKGQDADKYSSEELSAVRGHIIAAWKKHIDPAGPPSAQQKEDSMSTENLEDAEKAGAIKPPAGGTAPNKLPAADRNPIQQQDAEEEGEGEGTMGDDDQNDQPMATADEVVGAGGSKNKKPKAPMVKQKEKAKPDAEDAEDAADGGADEAEEGEAPGEDAAENDKKKKSDDVATLTALVTELTTSMKAMQESFKEVNERVAAVEETRQTRKGADVDDATASGEAKPSVSEGIADLRAKAMLGMRKR